MFAKRLFTILFLCLCWGAASGHVVHTKKTAASPATLCDQIENLSNQTPSNILVVGEVHGTSEIPQAVQCISQRLVDKGTRVVLGLELPPESLNAVTVSNGNTERLSANLQWDKFWDGKTSEAMFHLIAWAKQNGVEVLSVEASPQTAAITDSRRTTVIGERIAERAEDLGRRFPDKHWKLVSLVGRFHALNLEASDIPERLSDQRFGKPLIGIVNLVNGNTWACLNQHCGVQYMDERCNNLKTPGKAQHTDLCLPRSTASIPAVLRAARSDGNQRQ